MSPSTRCRDRRCRRCCLSVPAACSSATVGEAGGPGADTDYRRHRRCRRKQQRRRWWHERRRRRGSTGMGGGAAGTSNVMPGANGMVIDAKTSLAALPKMSRVAATATDDNVNITFDPVDGARDYRVYVLPDDEDISSDGSGHITIKNAVYRCAGDRQAPGDHMDDAKPVQRAQHQDAGRRVRASTATCGPGRSDARLRLRHRRRRSRPGLRDGRSSANADNECDFLGIGALGRFAAPRSTSPPRASARCCSRRAGATTASFSTFLAAAGASTAPRVHAHQQGETSRRPATTTSTAPRRRKRGKARPAFQVLTAAEADTQRR